ncbi:hypothetical protein BC936DRAFT_146770 [Jimgerdemannia flammicorona]|uniref:F-box domain-containing protein n=1 Tax=Jimgerdemannia flammicorona TaxID=994334 RepID=A0A433D6S4_9FUNG|nr:hypothetical protein BC936DRAFT_146770 [Jimgerdemannia flammicorona]
MSNDCSKQEQGELSKPRLPPEVLTQVFKCLLLDGLDEWASLDVVAASLVCKEWQAAAEYLFGDTFKTLPSSKDYDLAYFGRALALLRTSRVLGVHYGNRVENIDIDLTLLDASVSDTLFTYNQAVEDMFAELFALAVQLCCVKIRDTGNSSSTDEANSDLADISDLDPDDETAIYLAQFYRRILQHCHKTTRLILPKGNLEEFQANILIDGLSATLEHIETDTIWSRWSKSHGGLNPCQMSLTRCHNLRSFCTTYSDAALEKIIPSWPRLEQFCIESYHKNPVENIDRMLVQLGRWCPRLRRFELLSDEPAYLDDGDEEEEPSNAALCFLASRCPHLQYIAIEGNQSLRDSFLGVLGWSAKGLRYLYLDRCLGLNSDKLDVTWPELRRLSLTNCLMLDVAYVRKFVAAAPKLAYIEIPMHLEHLAEFLKGQGFEEIYGSPFEWQRLGEWQDEEKYDVPEDGEEVKQYSKLSLAWLRETRGFTSNVYSQ